MPKNIAMLLGILFHLTALGQDGLPVLDNYFNDVRNRKEQANAVDRIVQENPEALLAALNFYFSDTSSLVRSKAYSLTQYVGARSTDYAARKQAIRMLVKGASDPDAGNVRAALTGLTYFTISDFSNIPGDNIMDLLISHGAHNDLLFKLVGFAQLSDAVEMIRPYTLPGNSKLVRWAAVTALARMNDRIAIEELITRVQKLPINDDVVQTIFPDLIYTRQKPAIDYLVQVMNSNEKNCTSANPNSEEKIVCGYRIMEMLAPAIEGYPLELDASGDIKTTNYEEALATVRAWFASNPDYVINRDTY